MCLSILSLEVLIRRQESLLIKKVQESGHNELDGDVEPLEVECDFKPNHETCGMSYAKWFLSIEKRNKLMEFTKVTIKKIQGGKK